MLLRPNFLDALGAMMDPAIAESVPESKLDVHAGEDWSSRQVIHHCADSEAQSYARLRRLVAEPNPIIQGYDEALWAKDQTLGYTTLPVENSIAVFKAVRAASLATSND